ncbi:MAG: hypothetical protein K6U74_07065 [Firmicutes bacterium]|nr:hypothetical protein [Bacillota bacterium]
MAEVVKVVASSFKKELSCDIVYILQKEGARRFYELSAAMHGEENVKKYKMHAPYPSIFIDGELVFDQIPSVEELAEVVRNLIEKKNGSRT